MVIETDNVFKDALKNKLSKIIDNIPVNLESLEITSTSSIFKMEWKKAKDKDLPE